VARELEAPLELAVRVGAPRDALLRSLADEVAAQRAAVSTWLLFGEDGLSTPDGLVEAARVALAAAAKGARFGGGSERYFAELNRRRPPTGLDRVSFSMNPQVHAFDDATLVENLATLPALAATVRSFAPGAAVAVSPVTLRPRQDPRPASSREPGEAPFTDDPRQPTAFAAAWTLGLLASAAAAQVASLTLFEMVGPRGVMRDGEPFPVFHALADVAAMRGGAVLAARSRRPERVLVLALSSSRLTRVFLANVTAESHPVRVEGLDGAVRRTALGEPADTGEECGFEVDLAPRAIVRLDVLTAER
jgi:hypothetical protein